MAFVVFNLLAAAALIGIDQAIKLWAQMCCSRWEPCR